LIDLHSHTNESDGTCSPAQLVAEAVRSGVTVLGITDHDTFKGYDQALPSAARAGLELVCGIELSTKLHGHSAHLLGYFLNQQNMDEFRKWVAGQQAARRDRNIRLVARLRELGFDVTLAEAEARGRGMTGRPHFAQIMVEKGYVSNLRQAFDDYLDESAKGYVFESPPTSSTNCAPKNRGQTERFPVSGAREPLLLRHRYPAVNPNLHKGVE
jgi:predicted metal-dependent phosphoesterase TrpH